jgi:predicted ATPase
MALTAWQLGEADSARVRISEAIALADRLRKPHALAHNRFYAAYLAALLRDPATCQKFSQAVIEQSKSRPLPLFFDICKILRGWALSEQGRCEEGVRSARDGLANFRAAGNRLSLGSFLGFLAEALARAGALDEALATVAEALSAAPDQRVDLPYLLWLRGQLFLQQDRHRKAAASGGTVEAHAAEQCFRDAVSLANRIGAKTYELRAATSLGELLVSQGRSVEARDVILPLFKNFAEGCDTREVIEAKVLVDELS